MLVIKQHDFCDVEERHHVLQFQSECTKLQVAELAGFADTLSKHCMDRSVGHNLVLLGTDRRVVTEVLFHNTILSSLLLVHLSVPNSTD